MKTEAITSAQNPKIKTLLELQEKSKGTAALHIGGLHRTFPFRM